MPVDIDSHEGHIIRKMVPFSTMPNSIFKVICDKIVLENVRSGAFLFKRGDTAKELIYLLKGDVSLEVDKLKMEVIKAGTESARFALAHQLPRKVNGIAKSSVQFLRLNSVYITTPDLAELKKQEPSLADAKENGQKWISTLLTIPVLKLLPATQLSRINDQLEEVNYEEGETVVRQGDFGEYYYLIKSGECVISHKDSTPEKNLTATKLKTGDSFGAEALISDAIRNQTVTALTLLSLLRINKERFLVLIKKPLLKFVDELETQSLLDSGGVLLDVRPAAEYEKSHWEQASNVPLLNLRNHTKLLDKTCPIVVVSDEQNLSEAAVFLLLSYKFSAHVSKKSIEPLPTELVINIRQPVSHSFASDTVLFDDNQVLFDELMPDNKLVIETRSVPKHSTVPDLLAEENVNLQQQIKELTLKAEKSEQEKQEITQKYQLLLKQSERLKEMLESLTKQNGRA